MTNPTLVDAGEVSRRLNRIITIAMQMNRDISEATKRRAYRAIEIEARLALGQRNIGLDVDWRHIPKPPDLRFYHPEYEFREPAEVFG